MGDLRKQLDALARELGANAVVNDAASANAKPSAHDQEQPTPLFPEPKLGQQKHSELSQEALDLAILELGSSMGIVPGLPGERAHKSRASAIFGFCAVGGVAALVAWLMVFSSTRPVVEKVKPAAPLIALDRNNEPSQASAEVTREPNQTPEVKEPALLPEPMPVTPPAAPSPPSQAVSNAQADAAPVTKPPSRPQATSIAADAAPLSTSQSSPPPPPDVEAGAAPSSGPPSQTATNAQTRAALVTEPPSPSIEADATPVSVPQSSPPSPSSGPPSPPSQAADAQADAASVTEPPSSSPQAINIAADATPVSSPPPAPDVEARATPSSGPPSSPSQASMNAQAETAPVTEPPSSIKADAAPVPAPQSSPPPPSSGPPSPPASTVSGSQLSPAQLASVEIGQGPVSELQSPRAPGASTLVQLNDAEITVLINHAKDFLKNGDFASARLLLRRAAEAGSADASLMLGETFDPFVMQERHAIGIAPDIAQASQWYEKAAKLGSDVATKRIAKLLQIGH